MPPALGWLLRTISGTEETKNQGWSLSYRLLELGGLSAISIPEDWTGPQRPRPHCCGHQGLGLGPWKPRAALGQQTVLGLSEDKSS